MSVELLRRELGADLLRYLGLQRETEKLLGQLNSYDIRKMHEDREQPARKPNGGAVLIRPLVS